MQKKDVLFLNSNFNSNTTRVTGMIRCGINFTRLKVAYSVNLRKNMCILQQENACGYFC